MKEMENLLAVLKQSESNSLEENQAKQKHLIQKIIKHAKHTVPIYAGFDVDTPIENLPILTRKNIQFAGDSLASTAIPDSHGETYSLVTSGSTGEGVHVLGTNFTRLFYDALMLREHLWHSRDLSQKLMTIRWVKPGIAPAPTGHYQETWGLPIEKYQKTGPSVLINIASKTHLQVEALIHHNPYYLATYPSQLEVLAQYCAEQNITLPGLREVRTTGEILTQKQINTVKNIWPHIQINDIYSCVEIGNLAQQCPEYKRYHINTEHVYFELINQDNKPCQIGEEGKVLVTSLMNYATPLIRYELGDHATFGEPCPCGRGLPVLSNILGRTHNRLKLPNAESRFPYLGELEDLARIVPIHIQRFQFVQHTLEKIEIKVVTPDTVTPEQEAAVIAFYQDLFAYDFDIEITYHEAIAHGPTGKYEEFISYV